MITEGEIFTIQIIHKGLLLIWKELLGLGDKKDRMGKTYKQIIHK